MSTRVRPITPADVVPVGAVLARAFDDDPLFCAILPEPAQRARALRALFEEWTRILHLPHDTSSTTDDHSGAALWSPPGQWSIGLFTLARLAPRMLGDHVRDGVAAHAGFLSAGPGSPIRCFLDGTTWPNDPTMASMKP